MKKRLGICKIYDIIDIYLNNFNRFRLLRRKLPNIVFNLKIVGIITVGAFTAALGVSLFLTPTHMVAGGLSGLGIILHTLFGCPVGAFMLLANIPLLCMGFRTMGTSFLLRTLYGTVIFSLLTDAVAFLPPLTNNLMLCALYGGGLLGIGMGVIFLVGGTTGGTDIVAQLLHRRLRFMDVGKWCLTLDVLIIMLSAFLFQNAEACLYGIIAAIVSGILIDMMLQGANVAKVVYVISTKAEAIAADVINTLERGVTAIYSRGMYHQQDGLMLLCVIKSREIPRFEQIVLSHDKNAFIIFTGARSVSGEGFKIYPIN